MTTNLYRRVKHLMGFGGVRALCQYPDSVFTPYRKTGIIAWQPRLSQRYERRTGQALGDMMIIAHTYPGRTGPNTWWWVNKQDPVLVYTHMQIATRVRVLDVLRDYRYVQVVLPPDTGAELWVPARQIEEALELFSPHAQTGGNVRA